MTNSTAGESREPTKMPLPEYLRGTHAGVFHLLGVRLPSASPARPPTVLPPLLLANTAACGRPAEQTPGYRELVAADSFNFLWNR